MKSILISSATALLSLGGIASTAQAQTIILQDNFDSYTPGGLANSSAWPSAIPGTAPALSWSTNSGGPQSIAGAPGRSGNAYRYQEIATGQTATFSSVTLPEATGADQWHLSMDFYLDSLNSPSWFGITAIGNGTLSTATNALFNLAVSRNSATNNIGFAVGGDTFFSDDTGRIAGLNTWYSVSAIGDKASGTIDLTISGDDYLFTRTFNYREGHTDFTTIAIGDTTPNAWAAGRSNSVYLDNFRLQAIPEPSTIALLPLALATAGAARILRQRKSRP